MSDETLSQGALTTQTGLQPDPAVSEATIWQIAAAAAPCDVTEQQRIASELQRLLHAEAANQQGTAHDRLMNQLAGGIALSVESISNEAADGIATRTVQYGPFTLVMCAQRGTLTAGKAQFVITEDGTITPQELARLVIHLRRMMRVISFIGAMAPHLGDALNASRSGSQYGAVGKEWASLREPTD